VADDRESEELMPFDGDELPPLHGG
jgi:hypothetical protein